MTKVLVVVADGSEEMETVIIVDVLRRAQFEVTLASLTASEQVTCSRGIRIVADASLASVNPLSFDAIVLPGGLPGAEAFAGTTASKELCEMLRGFESRRKVIAAVCAAPLALAAAGVGAGKRATSHPSVRERLGSAFAYTEQRVAVADDALLVTSRGPGTCFEFALAVVRVLACADTAAALVEAVAAPMILHPDMAI